VGRRQIRSLFLLVLSIFAARSIQTQSRNSMPSQPRPSTSDLTQANGKIALQQPGAVRVYFIAADELDWDYTPRGRNVVGLPRVESSEADEASAIRHRVYHKAVYREYTDATFTHLKPRPPEWEHLGILGPLIRAEVGDSIRVVFRNNTHLSVSMHPHGLEYKKDAEGASYNDGTSGTVKADDKIAPGATFTYLWRVPERSGPAEMDGSSVLWMYHSHFVESRDINTGLIGPIIVTARGMARPDGSPKDVDREFITDFSIFDETESWFFEHNASRDPGGIRLKAADPMLRERNLLYSINGYTEGNLPLITMKRGEKIRWYLLSNSNEDDVHMAHWHGNTLVSNKMRMDSVALNPMAMVIADMVPDDVGTWLFHCHVDDHLKGGMVAVYQVLP
jgi:manganese oxidase